MNDFSSILTKLSIIGYDGTHEKDNKIIESIQALILTLDYYELSNYELETVLSLISSEGRDKLNNLPDKLFSSEWQEFDYGNVSIGHFVKVKDDAYSSEKGSLHNGLVGTLSFMSARHCTVNYIGFGSGKIMKHPMENLLSLKIR